MRVPPGTFKLAPAAIIATLTSCAMSATFTEYIDKTEWQDAVGQWTTIGFADLQAGTIVTTQYSDLGVTFTDDNDSVYTTNSFLEDGYGLQGGFPFDPNDDIITVEFNASMQWIGVDYPGALQMELYLDDTLLHVTELLKVGGEGFFSGVVSDMSFNRVRLFNPFGFISIDDLHFGGVPAPGALPLLSVLLLRSRRR